MDKTRRPRKKRPVVISRQGRYRFQTGLITAHLLDRGLAMVEATELARELRDHVAQREEITTAELRAEVEALLARHGLRPDAPHPETGSTSVLEVLTPNGVRSYDPGLVYRDSYAAGVAVHDLGGLGEAVHARLSLEGDTVEEERIAEIAAEVIRERFGKGASRRYRLARWVRRADRPVVLLLGGATGTGKSSLAMELAYRLGIRSVISTDIIRETMRTLLSPEVVPGLHDHSFRGIVQGGQVVSDPRERVLAGFRQQSEQVAVGVRAAIRRAVREWSHLIVEGTHLVPPFSRFLPPGAAVYYAGLVLAVPDEARHLSRFPQRAKPTRGAEPYLESFQAVRWIHDDLLQAAEDSEAIVLATEDFAETTQTAVEYLARALPIQRGSGRPARTRQPDPNPGPPTLVVVMDGLADEPNPALGERTPMDAAHTPFIDALAGSGGQGQINTGGTSGKPPTTDSGLSALLGLVDDEPIGRGLYEALGQGVPLAPGAVLFRGNLATIDRNGVVMDRRAGRIREGAADLLAHLRGIHLPKGVRADAWPGHEHRLVVALQGSGLSQAVGHTDPGENAAAPRELVPTPLDDSPEAARTAEALREFLRIASEHLRDHPVNAMRVRQGLLPANGILTRGAARVPDHLKPGTSRVRTALISACSASLGVARAAGMTAIRGRGMTGNLDTDIQAKLDAAADMLRDYPMVVVHLKGTDIAAHDRRPDAKRAFIERFDLALGHFLRNQAPRGLRIVITADHGTSSITGSHMMGPVPLLMATHEEGADLGKFTERTAELGALGMFEPGELDLLLWAR